MFFLPFTRKPYPKFCQILEAAKKTPVPETLFDKVAGLRPATLLKKSRLHRCFPVNFAKFLRNLFYKIPRDDCFRNIYNGVPY